MFICETIFCILAITTFTKCLGYTQFVGMVPFPVALLRTLIVLCIILTFQSV